MRRGSRHFADHLRGLAGSAGPELGPDEKGIETLHLQTLCSNPTHSSGPELGPEEKGIETNTPEIKATLADSPELGDKGTETGNHGRGAICSVQTKTPMRWALRPLRRRLVASLLLVWSRHLSA